MKKDLTKLINSCSRRPSDEDAWHEFVRRFHPKIHVCASKVFSQLTATEERNQHEPARVINDIVQGVYLRLIEDGSYSLRRSRAMQDQHIDQYIVMICANVALRYFRQRAVL